MDSDGTPDQEAYEVLLRQVAIMSSKYRNGTGRYLIDIGKIIHTVSAIIVVKRTFEGCTTLSQYHAASLTGFHYITGRYAYDALAEFFQKRAVQADSGEVLDALRSLFDKSDSVFQSSTVMRIRRLYTYVLIQGWISQTGVTLEQQEFNNFVSLGQDSKYKSRMHFMYDILESSLYFAERIFEFKATGSISSLLHGETTYTKWFCQAEKIIQLSQHTANLEAHGTSYFSYLAELNQLIEQGESFVKMIRATTQTTRLPVMFKTLERLKMLKMSELTRQAAQAEREAPLGVLVSGASSVGKSLFMQVLFSHFGKVFKLDTRDHFRYVRSPTDRYWSNFDSSMWCVQFDDIAYLNPARTTEIEPTLNDVIACINNVPYCPPQADIVDKGKTPVKARLVMASTNVPHLNFGEYFSCPLAPRRRFSVNVHLTPKKEFLAQNQVFIDPEKIKDNVGLPDFWDIAVYHVVPTDDTDKFKLMHVREFTSMNEFLCYFGKEAVQHRNLQEKAIQTSARVHEMDICPNCYGIECMCSVMEVQSKLEDITGAVATFAQSCFTSFFASWLGEYMFDTLLSYRFTRLIAYRVLLYIADPKLSAKFCGRLTSGQYISSIAALVAVVGLIRVIMLYFRAEQSTQTPASVQTASQPYRSSESTDPPVPPYVEKKVQTQSRQSVILSDSTNALAEVQTKDEGKNVWYQERMGLTPFDIPKAASGWPKDIDGIKGMIGNHVVRVKVWTSQVTKRSMNGVFLEGNLLLVSAHLFKGLELVNMDLYRTCGMGITDRVTQIMNVRDISFDYKKDIALVRVFNAPPLKSILPIVQEQNLGVTFGDLITREDSGELTIRRISNIAMRRGVSVPLEGYDAPVYFGKCDRETIEGDCGSLLIGHTGYGPVVIGIHFLGAHGTVGAVPLFRGDIERIMPRGDRAFHVQGGFSSAPRDKLGTPIELGDPHFKSIFRFIESGRGNVFGSFTGYRSKPKSRVTNTPLSEFWTQKYGKPIGHGPPILGFWQPLRQNVLPIMQMPMMENTSVVKICAQSFLEDIVAGLPEGWESELFKLNNFQSVNGIPGKKYIDRIDVKTSMGFPWNCSKKRYLHPVESQDYPNGVDFDDDFYERVAEVESLYAQGKRAYPVFTGHEKDEPVSLKKIKEKRNRLFMGGPIDWGIAARKIFLSFIRLVQMNKFVFEAAPGTNAMSREWSNIYRYLTQFGTDRMNAGDFRTFDKKMSPSFILLAFWIIYRIHKKAGWTHEEALPIMCVGYDIAFSLCIVDMTMVEFFGSNPSGQILTVILNCFVNSLYHRYAYFMANPDNEVTSFRERVALLTYGDDCINGVSIEAPWFNHVSIQRELSKIGVDYTMADKSEVMIPYLDISECSFLKRTWRFDEELQEWFCPLDEESIFRSLTVWTSSSSIEREHQMVEVMASAHMEYFFHSKTQFRWFAESVAEALTPELRKYVGEGTFKTYRQLQERFVAASLEIPIISFARNVPEVKPPPDTSTWFQKNNRNEKTSAADSARNESTGIEVLPGTFIPFNEPDETLEFVVQSLEDDGSPTGDPQTETSEVVTFIDSSAGVVTIVDPPVPATVLVDGTSNTDLGRFLSRPTLIDTRTWTTASTIGVIGSVLEPWYLFMNDTIIKRKLESYAFIRANLHIKVMVNATPFHFGMMRVAYEPSVNATGTGFSNSRVRSGTAATPLLVPYSQMPGTWVTPADNSGGEFVVPFFLHSSWLSLSSSSDVKSMGNLTYFIAAPLGVASASGSTSVLVSTYAWLDNVELSGSTNQLVLQAKDEYVGPISGTARMVANAARALREAPLIGRFARASEIGATAVRDIASMFGFTNIPNIADVDAFVPLPAPHLATAQISVPFQKLTLDPKQELSVDPTIVGVPQEDELALSNFTSKWSFFAATGWSTSDNAGTVIWNARVSPMLFGTNVVYDAGVVERARRIYHTPLSYAAMLFQHWRGDIELEIRIVCTKFHKGRLRVSWDPRGGTGTSAPPDNSVYTTILDIAESNVASFRIPFHQAFPWLRNRGIIAENWTVGNALSYDGRYDNGLLTVSVMTPLISPVSPQNLSILFFVRGADNFEYANPRSHLGESSSSTPPSFFAVQAKDEVLISPEPQLLGDISNNHPERYGMNFGEAVASLRTLLHRMSMYDSVPINGGSFTRLALFRKSYSRLPPVFGYDPLGLSGASKVVTAGTAQFNFVPTHPIAYLAFAFAGFRGSVNYTAAVAVEPAPPGTISVQRVTDSTFASNRRGTYATTLNTGGTSSGANRSLNGWAIVGQAGAALTSALSNSIISWNYPDENGAILAYTSPYYSMTGNDADWTSSQGNLLEVLVKQSVANTSSDAGTVTTFAGTGPDFNLLWFICCPTVDYYTALPAAT